MSALPRRAMVLAAGLGKRMRPLTDHTPKPLIEIAGKSLLDWGLDALGSAGVETAVVNTHYLGDQIVRHVAMRQRPAITISDERDALLDSAGGIVRALPILGHDPFLILNADTFWIDGPEPELHRLGLAWNDARMDILVMLAHPDHATGHSGSTDFLMDGEHRLSRARGSTEGFIYAGVAILHPRIFEGAVAEPHSLNLYFDRAIAAGRLFGLPMNGHWITVGTPDAVAPAEAAVRRGAGR
ncbi:MobA-like NTP transferase domain-containing protein [Aquamicrobium aerolatum DSM 21857]|uniref:MobA-like NTP transferase domain-containing protein n=2 Tax=Aerobium TaxID=3143707 RepID=A0A1I3NRC1_9HYPH|nr:MobA-like NTP transferase domain-containing protein [Aquamicrobium aerolatum DSM 21857]